MKIKKGDHVIVVAGKDKGATGTVIAVYPDKHRVLVQGVNMVKINKKVTNRATTGTGVKEGGITHQEASIHVSNVQLVDSETHRPGRVGYRTNEDGKKVRVLLPSGKEI
jgi:large subunit ribosomal protein L24